MKTDPLVAKFRAILSRLADAPDDEVLAAAYQSPAIHFALFCSIRDKDNKLIHGRSRTSSSFA